MARHDSRHRSPEKGRDAESYILFWNGTVKINRPCYQNAWWTFAKENPLWRTTSWKTLPLFCFFLWSEEAIQGHPQSLPYKDFNIPTESWEQITQDRTKWRGLIRRGAGEYEAKRVSEAEQKRAQRKARAKASPTELSSSDLSCSICNRQFRVKIGPISHLRTHK